MKDPAVWLMVAFGCEAAAASMILVVFPLGVVLAIAGLACLVGWEVLR